MWNWALLHRGELSFWSFYRQRPFSAQILLSFFHCSHLHSFHSQPFRRFLGRQQNPVFFIICAHTEASTIVCSLHILTEFKLSITLTSWSYLMTSLREFPFLVCRLTNVYHKDFLNWAFDNNYTHNPSVNYQQTVGTACFSGFFLQVILSKSTSKQEKKKKSSETDHMLATWRRVFPRKDE